MEPVNETINAEVLRQPATSEPTPRLELLVRAASASTIRNRPPAWHPARLVHILCVSLLSLGLPLYGQSNPALLIGPGFALDRVGSLTSNPAEVIRGKQSIKGQIAGPVSGNIYLRANSGTLLPLRTYRLRFQYKILVASNSGFQVSFFSTIGGGLGNFRPSFTITGPAGSTGTGVLIDTLGFYSDYEVVWNILGQGAIAVDDIQIVDVATGVVVASEDAEGTPKIRLAQAFLPPAQTGRTYSVGLVAMGGRAPYTWSAGIDSLPSGIQLSPDGYLLGRASTAGTYIFEALVTDATGASAKLPLTIIVNSAQTLTPGPALSITNQVTDPWQFVGQTYEGLTGLGTGFDIDGWVAQLQSGAITGADLLGQLWSAPGVRDRAVFSVTVYEALLGRAPTFSEYRSALGPGVSDIDLVTAVMNTAEFGTGFTSLSPDQKVAKIFRNLLGTDPDAALLQKWLGQGAGADLVSRLLRDPALQPVQSRISAAAAYLWLDHRPPTAVERATLAGQLGSAGSISAALGPFLSQAQFRSTFDVATIRPQEYKPAFRNPLGGMRTDFNGTPSKTHTFSTLYRQMIQWNLLENSENDTVEKIRQMTDQILGDLPRYNIKAILRVYLVWPQLATYWPSDLTTGDYTSIVFRTRMKRLISRLGEAWNNDPRIAFIETGIIGYWGEQHDPSFASSGRPDSLHPEIEKEFGDAYQNAFPAKLLMNRNPKTLVEYPFGMHWDVFGATIYGNGGENDIPGLTAILQGPAHLDKWKIAPRGGEMGPPAVGEPDHSITSFNNAVRKNASRFVDFIRNVHWNHVSTLKWMDVSYTADADLFEKATRIQNALGYRFVIDEADYSPVVQPGQGLTVRLKVRNIGSSPFYYPWPLEVALLDVVTRRPVWKTTWDGLDLRSWLPGSSVDILRTFAVPSTILAGQYVVALAILDPSGMVPAARFAVANYWMGGRTPLGPVSVAGDRPALQLNEFDDIQGDWSLYYLPPTAASAPSGLCTTSLDTSGPISAPAAGLKGTIRVTSSGGCTWTASTVSDWVRLSPATATGNGTVSYTIAPNAGAARVGYLVVAGRPIGLTQAAPAAPQSKPAIQAIVDSWDYTAGVAPGAWVTIAGTLLAEGSPRNWDLTGLTQLPTTLNNVTVTFNGTPASLLYVSPTQINALVPAGVNPGPVEVIVTSNGVSSSPFSITATATLPSVYAIPNTDGSSFFVTAALQGTGFLVGNKTWDARVVRAAQPGDILDLYMIGLGSTADGSKFVTDRLFSGAFPVSTLVTATVGGKDAPVAFAGLTSPGLYLVRIAVPRDVAAGPQILQISAGGLRTRPDLLLMVDALPSGNLVQNGGFESAFNGNWTFFADTAAGASATATRSTSGAKEGVATAQISVSRAATQTTALSPYFRRAVQFWHDGMSIQKNAVYTLRFWAKASNARITTLNLFNYGFSTNIALGLDWQQYVVYFQGANTGVDGRLNFEFGDQAGEVWLDDVRLY